MIRAGIWMGLVMIACGGSATPQPEAPDDSAQASEHEDKKSSSDSKSGDESKGDDAKSDDAKSDGVKTTGAPASEDPTKSSGDVVQTVLQLVIEDPELDKYLRLGEPGRFPLKIAGKDVPATVSLTKAGQPVKILQSEPVKKDAALVITKIDIAPPDATVGYRFDIEGVVGTAHLKKLSYGWELKSSRIVEHYRSDSKKE
jgi:hypothetical protein